MCMNNNNLYHSNNIGTNYPMPSATSEPVKPQIVYPSSDKFSVGVTPGAVVGALVGGAIAKKNIENKNNQILMQERAKINNSKPTIEGDYYKQIKTVADNLSVIFTPVSVIFTVKNGGKVFTLDTVETTEMNNDMKLAWKMKDQEYFKSLMMNKMFNEMQIAEQHFTKNFIKKQMQVKDMLNKDASDTSFLDNISEADLSIMLNKSAQMFKGEEMEKVALAIVSDIADECEEIRINFELDRPISKYAGVFDNIKDSLGFHSNNDNLKSMKKKLENPQYVMKKIKVGFFPDRVIFSLDNQLVSTLTITSMNDEGYEHFSNKDTGYFKNFFADNIKENLKKSDEESTYMYKSASETEVINTDEDIVYENCLLHPNAHPVAIYLYLTTKLGLEWLTYEISIIESIIKAEFNLKDIPDSTLNKIMSILAANQSDNPFINAYSFEKVSLSLCSKSIDFLSKEVKNLSIQDVAFTLDVLDRVTPYDDIYDNFSAEVMNYMCDVLVDKDMYIYYPTNIISSPLEPAFTQLLNEMLLAEIKSKMTLSSTDEELNESIRGKCEYIADNSLGILKSVRRVLLSNPESQSVNKAELIDRVIDKKNISGEFKEIIKRQVLLNIALDEALAIYDSNLKTELKKYNILRPGGDDLNE